MITLVVPENYTWFFVNTDEDMGPIDDILEEEMMYWQQGAEYSSEYKSGQWDGYVRLYKRKHHGAPMGLMDRAKAVLKENGYDVKTIVKGHRKGDAVDLNWTFPYELREYQKEAVTAVLENRGGIVGLPTGMGKTVVAMRLLYQLALASGRGIVLVHTKELMYQWGKEIEKTLGVEPGLIGDGEWSEGPVTIAIMQSLISRGVDTLDEEYGVAIYDECHRTSAAETMNKISMDLDTDYRIGLSATPWRRVKGEEMKIEGAVGGNVYSLDAERGIREGWLTEPRFEIIVHHGPMPVGGEDYHDAFARCIEYSEKRNGAIAAKACELAHDGYKVLVNVNRIDQGQHLTNVVNDLGIDAEFLCGSHDSDRRQIVLDLFENHDLPVLVSTLIKEGVDIPSMSAIILAHGGKSDIETIQVIGRALRPANGDHAMIVDVKDDGRYFKDAFRERQNTMAEYYGEYYTLPYGDASASRQKEPPKRRSLTEPLTEEEEEELFRSFFGK